MNPLVVDTGILVKVFIQEEDSPLADALFRAAARGTHRLVAPDFSAIEFGNVLWKYVQRSVLSAAEARERLEQFPYDHIQWLPALVLLSPAFDFATRYGVAVYDGAFLAGASMLAVDFITADEILYQKVSPHLPWVRLLRDFRT